MTIEVSMTGSASESIERPAPSYQIDKDVASGEIDRIKDHKFGTLFGVFLPTLLNILGVIMYLRLGWIVGNAGLGGTIVIILFAYFITGTTGLSMSSIVTNIRLGAGGVFSIVSQSLGLEVGGSVGLQFYLAQTFATAMYIYGFIEAWRLIFPLHPPAFVILGVYLVMVLVSYLSTSLAIRLQTVVMFGMLTALSSMFLGLWHLPEPHIPQVLGNFEYGNFWFMFAIFFPAATDVMVGATMSGNLKNARWSIPVGTLSAWGTTLIIYLALAVWYATVASPDVLKSHYNIASEKSFWSLGVLIGILASCFNAGLSSLTVGPRVLQSLGQHKIVPFPKFFGKLQKGEPRNALMFTSVLLLLALTAGNLNILAQFVTVCFLLTYFTINSVLVIDSQLKMVSFRPSLKLPVWVPLFGSLASLTAIIVISPFWGLVSILLSIGIYVYLNTRDLETPWETIRGGVLVGIVTWASKKVIKNIGTMGPRSWKPDLLVPIERRTQLEGYHRLIKALIYPQGTVQVIAMMHDRDIMPLIGLNQSVLDLQNEGVFASASIIEATEFISGLETTVDVLSGTLANPNILFISILGRTQSELQRMVDLAQKTKIGVVFYVSHPDVILGKEQSVNLWVRDQSPEWHLSFNLSNLDLSFLLSYQLTKNWKANLRILSVIQKDENLAIAQQFIKELMVIARMPKQHTIQVVHGQFFEFLTRAPRADLNILGMSSKVDRNLLLRIVTDLKSSCLFMLDSGNESALA
ncbi:amino acid permease [Deltaproteobacteria bacterium TL4]